MHTRSLKLSVSHELYVLEFNLCCICYATLQVSAFKARPYRAPMNYDELAWMIALICIKPTRYVTLVGTRRVRKQLEPAYGKQMTH